jgi:serine protease Do
MNLLKKTACLALCVCLLFGLAGTALAADTMDTRTLAMVNKPGVVLVQTQWTADITWYELSFYAELEEDLVAAIEDMIWYGDIPNTEEAIYSAMVQLMIENMAYYAYTTGNAQTERASTAAVGTGFIVTPDGYMVTNAHVVHTDEEALYMQFAMSALEEYAVSGTNEFYEEMLRNGYQMTQEEWDGLASTYYSLLAQSMDIYNLQTSYICFMGNVTPGSDVSAKGILLDLRKIGEPIPGKDIAILKLDKTNLPTVTLGDDTLLRTGDKVYAMGYPAVATLSDALNVSQAIQEPTLT